MRALRQRASGRHDVVYEPHAVRCSPLAPGSKRAANVLAPRGAVETGLALRRSGSAECDGVEPEPVLSRQRACQQRGRIEAARAKPARMQRNGHDQSGDRSDDPAGRFANQRVDDRPRCRIEACETGARVFEAMDPAPDVTAEHDPGHTSAEWRARELARRAQISRSARTRRTQAICRRHTYRLTQRAAVFRQARELAIAGLTQRITGSDRRCAAGAGRRLREVEHSTPEFCHPTQRILRPLRKGSQHAYLRRDRQNHCERMRSRIRNYYELPRNQSRSTGLVADDQAPPAHFFG